MQEQSSSLARVIQKRYVVEGLLGRSNAGATYLVRDQRSRGRSVPVVLFVFKEVVESDKRARQLLASRASSLRRLQYPGLPRIYRVFDDAKHNRMSILMEYIEGQDLESLQRQQPGQLFWWPHVMSVVTPVIEAVDYLHSQKPPIIHGDIRPTNIIVQKDDDRIVLVDLGLIERCDDAVPAKAAGHFNYRAPEQYDGYIDVRADVYALGATLYTLVTGQLPPDARSRLAGMSDFVEQENGVESAIPLHVRRVIDRAMSLEAARRFSSVEEFWDALWLLEENSVPDLSFVQEGLRPPASPPEFRQAAAPPAEKPEPLPAESIPTSPPEQEDPDATMPLPRISKRGFVAGRSEEQENFDTNIRLLHLPPGFSSPDYAEEQRELNVEEPLPEPPAAPSAFLKQEKPERVTLSPGLLADVLRLLPIRKLSAIFLVLVLIIGLIVGSQFFSRARSLPAAAPPAIHALSPISLPTHTLAPGYPLLTGMYSGTIYDVGGSVSTTMALTNIQQNQKSFSGYLRLGPDLEGSGPFRGTIDTSNHLRFIVAAAGENAALFFEGAMQSQGGLSGDYYQCSPGPLQGGKCNRTVGHYGLWDVVQASA